MSGGEEEHYNGSDEENADWVKKYEAGVKKLMMANCVS